MQGSIDKKHKAEARGKRRDDIFKRKKRCMQVLYTEAELADRSEEHTSELQSR